MAEAMSVPESHASVITLSDLDRIKKSLSRGSDTDPHYERETLHGKSMSRVQNWGNTIEGLRIAKDRKKQEKIMEEEAKKRKTDEEESNYQAEKRRIAIERATKMLYDETDKVKAFHGTLLLSDVLKEREAQLEHLKRIKEVQKDQEEAWKKTEEERLKKYDAEEERREALRHERAMLEAQARKEQLELQKVKARERAEEERREGEAAKLRSEMEFKKERRVERKRREDLLKAREETVKANEFLQELKGEIRKQEDLEDALIAQYARDKEALLAERRAREQDRFNQKQNARQRMIDVQTKLLNDIRKVEDTLLDKQKAEAEERSEMEKQAADEKRLVELEAIKRSRRFQLDLKEKMKQRAADETKEYQRQLAERDKQLTAEEEELRKRMLERTKYFSAYQKRQADETSRTRTLSKDEDLFEAQAVKRGVEEDAAMFDQYARLCVDEYAAQGKSTIPMNIHLNKKPHIYDHLQRHTKLT